MKTFTFIMVLLFMFPVFSQNNNFMHFGFDFNINLYAPYTSKLNNVKSPYTIRSNTFNANIDTRIYQFKKTSFFIGVAYKKIKYRKFDAITSTIYAYGASGQTYYVNYTFEDKPDLISKSNSLGLSLEANYSLISSENYRMSLGLRPTVYFLEWYKSYYSSSDLTPFVLENNVHPLVAELPETFFLSSINTQLIYRITLLPKKGRTTISGKVSLGANIFSDWEQFKRYAWIGAGLEIGFLNKKDKKKDL